MTVLSKELIEKLSKAQSQDEVNELLKAAGCEEEDAAQIWEELSRKREAGESVLSLEELDAVSGGVDRDWLTEKCAATVEPGSHCWSNDRCYLDEVIYTNPPTSIPCSICGTHLYYVYTDFDSNPSDDVNHYKCPNCGNEESW